jgi:hypothetical protein
MAFILLPSSAQDGKRKKRSKKNQNIEVITEFTPVSRERWIERNGDLYVIVTRTTISKEHYTKIKSLQK